MHNSYGANPKQQLLIAGVSMGVAALLLVARAHFSANSLDALPAYHQEDARFSSRTKFDAAVDTCLDRFKGQDPFDVSTMVMETKMHFRQPSPHYQNLLFEEMKRRAKAELQTQGVESLAVFVITQSGPNCRLYWSKQGGAISYANEPFGRDVAQAEFRRLKR